MQSLDLVSPYFVPAKAGTKALVELVEEGVDIRVLTNSLAATDVTVVHAGYAKRRKTLLKTGIELYEMRRVSSRTDFSDSLGPFGSSGSSLHAKTFASDGERLFGGSFNFDPRSAQLNTELAFLIESPEMAQAVHAAFQRTVPERAYRVRLSEHGGLYWLNHLGEHTRRYDTEPNTTWGQRLAVSFFALLPIDWLL